jgi:DNA-binding SARP family transcriptional activator
MLELQQQSLNAPAPGGRQDFPLRIYTLGRFSVSHDVEPIRFARKTQRRPLQLLKVLIALGGRAIGTDQLAMALWPELEGDMAYNAFEITLHRLRRLLGVDRALVLRDGLLTLDNRRCWVDVWDFEQAASRAEMLLNSPAPDPDELDSLSARVIALYHGHFLGRETPEPWSISLRERLRGKFLRHLMDVARHWERIGRHEAAIQCYLKGLEVDDLAEIFYQQLMICYQQLSRKSEALAVYRRCRTTLSLVLSIAPSPATEAIRRRLTQA